MSLREEALEEIRTAISVGDLGEDRIFSAAGLAKTLGMSLSPVREAMMSLVADGTVEAVPNRGYRLAPVTPEDLEEILTLRRLLAGPAVVALCEVRDPQVVEVLRGAAAAAVTAAEAGDRKSFFAADRTFHALVLEHGLGARAAAIGLHLRDQSRTVDAAEAPGSPADAESAAQLVELVELVGEGRSAEARALVEENLGYFEG